MGNAGEQRRGDRLSVWMIMLLPVLVVASATFVYYTGVGLPTATNNQGVLVQPPRDIKSVRFGESDGKPLYYGDLPYKWSLFIPAPADCDEACRSRLYFTRQVHTALGRMQPSLRRFMVVYDGELSPATAELIAREYPNLKVLYLDGAAYDRLFGEIGPDPGTGDVPRYFLVDPGGFLMMYYTDRHDYKQLLHDLRFLIKESGEL